MTRIALLACALFLATACEAIPGMNMGANVAIQGSHETDSFMTGRLSTVQGFDDDLSVNTISVDDGWLSVDLHVEGRYGWVMLAGDVDISDMEPGDTIELSEDELWSFVGCAGPQSYNFDFDDQPEAITITLGEPADDADVDVNAPDSDGIKVTIDAGFGDEGGVTAVSTVPPQG